MENRVKVHRNVTLGRNSVLGDFVIIGLPPEGRADGELPTVIGDDAVIRSHTVIYAGSRIGRNFRTGHHALIREECTIGNDVSVGSGTVVEHHVVLRDGARVHSQAFLPEHTVLEEGAWIGPKVAVTNARYPRSPRVKQDLRGVRIGRNAKVGANSTLLPGVVLGEQCLVGAGSVVTRDVPAGKVVAGNPARVINDIADLPYELLDEGE